MKIAFIGTHGDGKAILFQELAARLKMRSIDCEIMKEVARGCRLTIPVSPIPNHPAGDGRIAQHSGRIALQQIELSRILHSSDLTPTRVLPALTWSGMPRAVPPEDGDFGT